MLPLLSILKRLKNLSRAGICFLEVNIRRVFRSASRQLDFIGGLHLKVIRPLEDAKTVLLRSFFIVRNVSQFFVRVTLAFRDRHESNVPTERSTVEIKIKELTRLIRSILICLLLFDARDVNNVILSFNNCRVLRVS